MNRFKTLAFASIIGLATFGSTAALADEWNKKTIMTINEPIQVPGKVLAPGKYVMRLLDSPSNRHIVQIYDATEQHLQTTVLAIPNYRLQPTGDTRFTFWETPAGQPKALRSWFYPGDNFGQEFAYPKEAAVAIAQTNNQSVVTTFAQTEQDLTTARVGTVNQAGTEMELDRQTYARNDNMQPNTPAPKTTSPAPQTEVAQNTMPANTPAATPMPAQTMPARSLPRTGSELPLVGLMGLLSLAAAGAVRTYSKRVS